MSQAKMIIVIPRRYGQTSIYRELMAKHPLWSRERLLAKTKEEWVKRYGGAQQCKPSR